MIDLLARPPDSWQLFTTDGHPPSVEFYYGVQVGESHLLAMGAHFGVVYSPNHYVHPESQLRPWHWCEFEVSWYQYRLGRPLERSYKQIYRRHLTRFEVPHFETLWLELLMMGRKTG